MLSRFPLRRSADISGGVRGEISRDTGNNFIPICRRALPVEPHGRIPGTVVALEHPAPVRRERQHNPNRLGDCAGHMNDRRIDPDDQIEVGNRAGGFGEIVTFPRIVIPQLALCSSMSFFTRPVPPSLLREMLDSGCKSNGPFHRNARMPAIRGAIADIAVLRKALPALPETANELKRVAASVKASDADVVLGPDATETRVKQSKLDQYRIVYFATHGLLAGEVSQFAKLNAEPALVLSLPAKPTELDDGLLTASEVAQLKLSADWVVLSACNTAAGDKPGAEALSGLARAFFYAGGRSLLVSHWEVETNSAVALMTGTFAALAANPKLSHGEALRQSMLAMINHPQQPNLVEPKYWAPFVVVGEPAKPTP